MKKFLILSLIVLSIFGFQSSAIFANSYERISFKNKNEFLLSLRDVLSESFSEDEVQKGLNVFNFREKIRNFEDFDTFIAAQPTNVETIIVNVKMLNLINNPAELNTIKSEIYEIAKNSATSGSLMDSSMIAAVAVVPALAIFSNSSSGPSLSINDVSTSDETASYATFTVTLSKISEDPVTVNYATSNGTATAGSDYTAVSSTTLTFNPGETTKTFNIAVLADSLDEANETVTLTLSSASNATISDATGTLTITDDDAPPSLSINDVTKAEVVGSSTTATFTVTLSTASGRAVTVSYATSDGTATAGSDYTAISATTLTFSAGDTTKTFNVTVLADTRFENSETATLTLSNASNATISDVTGTLTITDKELNSGTQATYDSSNENVWLTGTEFDQSDYGSSTRSGDYAPYQNINLHKALSYEDGSGNKMMGSGQIISIMDSGFLVSGLGSNSSTHTEFVGKTITNVNSSYFTTYNSSNNAHGTFVAGIAAGNYGTGESMGVAPDASLHLFDYSWGVTNGNKPEYWALGMADAESEEAIVSNNSWGFDDSQTVNNAGTAYNASANIQIYVAYATDNSLTGTQTLSAFASLDSDSNGANDVHYSATAAQWQVYIDSLNSFQDVGVVVFALSNNPDFGDADVSAALPELFSELEEAWITVANVNITGTSSQSFALNSAPCGSTADYCMAADGTQILGPGYNDYNVSGFYYENSTGTSFAAPQVSGAVALLASHFPNHSPEKLTDRLLASANNNIGFTQTGTVSFGNGVEHGYSNEAGHGILDIWAALQPITSNSYARHQIYAGSNSLGDSSYDVDGSNLNSSRSFGDAISKALENEKTYFYDALDGGFAFTLDELAIEDTQLNTSKVKLAQNSIRSVKDELKEQRKMNGQEQYASRKNYFESATSLSSGAVNEYFDGGMSDAIGNFDYFLPFLSKAQGGAGANLGFKTRSDNGFLILSTMNKLNSDNTKDSDSSILATYEDNLMENLSYGLLIGDVNEGASLLGMEGSGAFDLGNSESKTTLMSLKLKLNLKNNASLGLMGGFSKSYLNKTGNGLIQGMDEVLADNFALSYNVYGRNIADKFTFSLSQPHRIRGGKMDIKIAGLAHQDGTIPYVDKTVDLNPSGRQLDFSFGYARDLSKKTTVATQFNITKDSGHHKLNRPTGSIYLGLMREKMFGQDKVNVGAVLSESSGETNAKINYSLNW